jgi:hypothetical protein
MDIGLLIMYDAATNQFAVQAKEAWNEFVLSVDGVNAGFEVKPFSVNREGMGNSFTGQQVAEQLQIPFSSGLVIVQLRHGNKVEQVLSSAPIQEITDMRTWFRSVLVENHLGRNVQGLVTSVSEDPEEAEPDDIQPEKPPWIKQLAEATPGIWIGLTVVVVVFILAVTLKE